MGKLSLECYAERAMQLQFPSEQKNPCHNDHVYPDASIDTNGITEHFKLVPVPHSLVSVMLTLIPLFAQRKRAQ